MDDKYYLAAFKSRNQAIYLYSLFQEEDRNIKLISTPCILKVGCSYSLKFYNKSYIELILKYVDDYKLEEPLFYLAERIQGRMKYRQIRF